MQCFLIRLKFTFFKNMKYNLSSLGWFNIFMKYKCINDLVLIKQYLQVYPASQMVLQIVVLHEHFCIL